MVRRTITIDGQGWQVGVLPDDVTYPITTGSAPDLYTPWMPTAQERSADAPPQGVALVVGRLKEGASVGQARADVQRISSALVFPRIERVAGSARPWLHLALAAAGFVLLLACVIVASLLLSRTAVRGVEIATLWLARSTSVGDVLKAGSTAVIGGRRRHRLLASLLAGDVALVTVILIARR